MNIPPRRPKPRMEINSARRIFPVHRAFVRKHGCSIKGCKGWPIEFAHLRTAANSGMGLKPSDSYGISLCGTHHKRAHQYGHITMAEENGMTIEQLFEVAAEFARRSPDKALREFLRTAAADSSGAEERALMPPRAKQEK